MTKTENALAAPPILMQRFPDMRPPAIPYADFVAALPLRRAPHPSDIWDRWDLRVWRCSSRAMWADQNGARASERIRLEHSTAIELPQGELPGACQCGAAMHDNGAAGRGEQRAYLGWVLGLMSADEADLFVSTKIRNEPLIQLAILPILIAAGREIDELRGQVSELRVMMGLAGSAETEQAAIAIEVPA